jgi:hypothetical protein
MRIEHICLKAILRNPDTIGNARQMVTGKAGREDHSSLAGDIGLHLSLKGNRPRSLHAFVDALRWAAGQPVGS